MSTESHTQTEEATTEKSTAVQRRIRESAREAPRAVDRYLYLGIDRQSLHHVANQQARILYRIDGDAGAVDCRTEYSDLPEPRVDCYLDAVAAGVGWDDRRVLKSERLWAGFRP